MWIQFVPVWTILTKLICIPKINDCVNQKISIIHVHIRFLKAFGSAIIWENMCKWSHCYCMLHLDSWVTLVKAIELKIFWCFSCFKCMKIMQASHVIILYLGCYSYLAVLFYIDSIYESLWTMRYQYWSNCTGFVYMKELNSLCTTELVNGNLKLINNSWGKHKGNQHRDGVWICDETLA